METSTKVCSCGTQFTDEQSSGDTCFRCKIQSAHFGFRGATRPGRRAFHDTTIRGEIEASDRRIRQAGGNPKDWTRGGTRWV